MIVFVDENLEPKICDCLRHQDEFGHLFYSARRAPFAGGTPDVEWMRQLHMQRTAEHSKVIIFSGDLRISRNKAERQVLKELNFSFLRFRKSFCNLPWSERSIRYPIAWAWLLENMTSDEAIYDLSGSHKYPKFKMFIRDL